MTSLKYITGAEHGQILRVSLLALIYTLLSGHCIDVVQYLPPYLEGLWPEHQDLLLKVLRQLACIHLYMKSFTVHTEETLACLQGHIDAYGELTKVILLISAETAFILTTSRSFAT